MHICHLPASSRPTLEIRIYNWVDHNLVIVYVEQAWLDLLVLYFEALKVTTNHFFLAIFLCLFVICIWISRAGDILTTYSYSTDWLWLIRHYGIFMFKFPFKTDHKSSKKCEFGLFLKNRSCDSWRIFFFNPFNGSASKKNSNVNVSRCLLVRIIYSQ